MVGQAGLEQVHFEQRKGGDGGQQVAVDAHEEPAALLGRRGDAGLAHLFKSRGHGLGFAPAGILGTTHDGSFRRSVSTQFGQQAIEDGCRSTCTCADASARERHCQRPGSDIQPMPGPGAVRTELAHAERVEAKAITIILEALFRLYVAPSTMLRAR